MLFNFSWIIPNKLSGSNLPGRSVVMGRFDRFEMGKDLLELKNKGITTIASVIEELPKGFKEECDSLGLESLWFKLNDYDAPLDRLEEFKNFTNDIITRILLCKAVNVHCKMGIGRTGLTLTCLMGRMNNLNSHDAIKLIRTIRPNSIENKKQICFIQLYLDGNISDTYTKGVFE